MAARRTLRLVFLLLAVAGVGIGVVALRQSGSPDSPDGRAAARGTEHLSASPEEQSNAFDAGDSATSSALAGRKPFAELLAEAERGSPAAMRQVSELYAFCMNHRLDPAAQMATLDAFAELAAKSGPELQRVKQRMSARCQDVDPGEPIPLESSRMWLEQAAKGGDLRAQLALHVMDPTPMSAETAAALVARSREVGDPDALDRPEFRRHSGPV